VTVTYNYNKSPVDVGKLNEEILESSIVTALEASNFNEPDSLSIDFVSALSGGEQTILNAVVGTHGGVPIPWPADLPTFGAVPSGALIISNGFDSTYWGYDSLINLSDGPDGYYEGAYLKSTASGTEWDTIEFIELIDTPSSYAGYKKKSVRVNNDETGLEFVGGAVIDMDDTPATYSGHAGYILEVNESETALEFVDHTFITLHDTPTTYSGYANTFVTVKPDETGLEYTSLGAVSGIVAIAYAEDDIQSSTTSKPYQQKLSLTTLSLPADNYLIMWNYEWQYKHGNFKFKARVQVDNSDTIMEQCEEPTDKHSWCPTSGFKQMTLSSGIHYIDLDYCSSKSGKEAKIRRARLELWRV